VNLPTICKTITKKIKDKLITSTATGPTFSPGESTSVLYNLKNPAEDAGPTELDDPLLLLADERPDVRRADPNNDDAPADFGAPPEPVLPPLLFILLEYYSKNI